jgi:hypothetical protein
MATVQFNILNQLQTPAFYASSLATRPTFGFVGRIFIDTDNPSTGIYRDTGTAWVNISSIGTITGSGTAGNIVKFTAAGTIGNSIITESGTTISIAGKTVTRPTIAGEYAVTYLQQNAASSGWSLQADNSGNLNLVRLNNGTYAAIAFSWTSAGTITTNGNSITIGAVIGTGTGVLYSQRNFFTATNYGTTGTPVYEEILGYSYDGNSRFALDASNSYTNNQGTGFRFKITSFAGAAIYPLTFTNAVGDATFSGTLGINGVADNVKSDTYTPTIVQTSGTLTNIVSGTCTYTRVGKTVRVYGAMIFSAPVGINDHALTVTLPINTTLTGVQGTGVGNGYIVSGISTITACQIQEISANRMNFAIKTYSLQPNDGILYTFSYQIL